MSTVRQLVVLTYVFCHLEIDFKFESNKGPPISKVTWGSKNDGTSNIFAMDGMDQILLWIVVLIFPDFWIPGKQEFS